MRIAIVAVGKLKERHWQEAASEYLRRLSGYASVHVSEVTDRDLSHGEDRALLAESEDILRALPAGAHVIALDRQGRSVSSEDVARLLEEHMIAGRSSVAFVVGGSAGLHASVIDVARERWSFGRITLPHQLARVVLLEQIYRAMRIMRNEPYHR